MSPPTRGSPAEATGQPARTSPKDRAANGTTRHLELVPPVDLEAELSVVAEIADPIYKLAVLDDVVPEDFYDMRHSRIVARLRAAEALSTDDAAYVQNAVSYAWPVTKQTLSVFLDCASRRRRLRELEVERMRLYGVAT